MLMTFSSHTSDSTALHVRASVMTDTQFSYACLCGKQHWHGNGGNPHGNRTEFRSVHCRAQVRGDVCIHITDETVRKLKPKRKQRNDTINQNTQH